MEEEEGLEPSSLLQKVNFEEKKCDFLISKWDFVQVVQFG